MAIRKSNDIENESGDDFTKSKSTVKLANITERFDDSTDNDNPFDDAIQYINKKLDECVDEINLSDSSKVITSAQASAITANTAKVGTTSTERSRIAANHAKVGISTEQAVIVNNLHPEGGALIPTTTEKHTVSLSVTNSRGAYALVFTMVDSSGETPVTKTTKVNLG
eukprot:GHVR01081006.1.p1 GENE.GHVR01081006.1~~GHVR01081006.1.p1  ORF type:complete len:168 (+),score=31.13 GHVR01081006.1:110-613(+)